MLSFLFQSLMFILVGIELPYIMNGLTGHSIPRMLMYAGLVTLVCLVVRFAGVGVSVWLLRASRRRRHRKIGPAWNEGALVAWAGIRGGYSLVIALAIPFLTESTTPIPGRGIDSADRRSAGRDRGARW